ncbi:beta-N-acetylhexosaminidase [Carboxylicivirga marina]|uniref:beta-N-acetylhexosaminidase n=1 Tax=Carboxylicivirga marina TaxID=2800988 RepID=A0ABS1HMJ4_9BACT|nr:beta-N-acetylhexosaminidase [Carboxylicivirga marina]MBK3518894.1 beta-N-acetylhexosaminidase [Carboxylicivirga marina]
MKRIKQLLIFSVGLTASLIMNSCNPATRTEKADAVLPVIPLPDKTIAYEGSFVLDASTQIITSSEEQKKVALWFTKELQKQYDLTCQIVSSSEKENSILLKYDELLDDEAYALDIYENNISIKASSEAGYFYAFQSLLQLAPVTKEKVEVSEVKISQVSITDKPTYQWRGLMLDISRHFFGPSSIKQLIDQMAAQKMNRLHLHLTDDPGWRIEIKEYPKLHEIGSRGDRSNTNGPCMYLSEKEAREITAYANERQIMIIPEVDIPGHSGAIERAYPEFSGGNNTLNVANEEAVKMIETVIIRLSELFNTPYVHYGGDEVRKHNWNGRADMRAKMNELGLKNQHELEGWFDRRMANFIVESGLKPIAWDEACGFDVNKNTIIQWWRCRHPKVLRSATKKDYQVIISPADYSYLDYPQDFKEGGANWEGLDNGPNSLELIYKWKHIPDGFTQNMKDNVIGIEAALWTEFISSQKRLEYMAYPRLSAIAEKAWTKEENMNWESFQQRLSEQYRRYEMAGINYRIPDIDTEERKNIQPEAFEGPVK